MSDPIDPPYVSRPVKRRNSPAGNKLRARGLDRPNRMNGVKMSDCAVEEICKQAGADYTRTPAGRLWIAAWAIAVIGALEGHRQAERVRALVFFNGNPELREAAIALWRMKQREAVRELVERAGFGRGRDRLPTVSP